MTDMLKLGLIGLDTSHVVAFSKLLNNPEEPNHIPGARIVAGFPGASDDFELSRSRVDGFTKQLRDEFGVEIVDSPEAVAECVDLLLITSVDGRAHRKLFEQTVGFGRPTFVDKPFATSLADAEAIMRMAKEANVAVMSCSSFRYADNVRAALASDEHGPIVGCDVFGPMNIEPTQGGLFWYGIHCVEMIVAAMGVGCRRVQVLANAGADLVTAEWNDGRVASIHGLRGGHFEFGMALHRHKNFAFVAPYANERPNSAPMLEAILRSLPEGRSDVPASQTLEIMRIIEAANESRETGRTVELSGTLSE